MPPLFWQNVNFGWNRAPARPGAIAPTVSRAAARSPHAAGLVGSRRLLAWLLVLAASWLCCSGSSGAIAGPLTERLAQFPQWEERPPVQAAAGDLYYPDWFRGTWNVTTTLVDLAAPLAPAVTTPGFEQNRARWQQPLQFQARFVRRDRPPRAPGLGLLGSLAPPPPIVADRAFNSLNLIRAYLTDTAIDPNGIDVRVDPTNPNRQLTILPGDRRLLSTISARATEIPNANEFVTSEIVQQEFQQDLQHEFQRPRQVYLNQVETTTHYTHLAPADTGIQADQVTAIYLTPQDPDFDQAGDRPVALYRYHLTFTPIP